MELVQGTVVLSAIVHFYSLNGKNVMAHCPVRRRLSDLSACRGAKLRDQDVDPDGRERGVRHGLSGGQKVYSPVRAKQEN